jgi:hypothetical protein
MVVFNGCNKTHNFVSFHPILMFHTILESGDKTNNIGVNSRQSGQIRFSPRGCLAVLFNLEHPAY